MKIAVICHPNIAIRKRLSALRAAGHGITLISPLPCNPSDLPVESTFSPSGGGRFLRTFGYMGFFLQHRFELIYVIDACCPIGWIAAFCSTAPLVIATVGRDVFLDERPLPWFVEKNMHRMEKVASRVTTLSPYMKQHLVVSGIPGERLMLDYWGIDPSWFEPIDASEAQKKLGLNDASPVIFSCRLMRPLYRIEVIIEAVAHLKKTFPHITLVCSQYGADPVYQKKIHTLVREKNLEDQVIFMPENTPDRTIQEIYALCDTVVMVPLSDGMPSCLMEAWASRKPAIVSNIANYEDPWHEHLVLKSDPDSASLASSIQRVLEDKGLAQRLTENGFAYASKHYKGLSDNGIFDDLPPQKKSLAYKIARHVWGGILFAGYTLDFYLSALLKGRRR